MQQFPVVEQAISTDEWPYDNGDDPSFYVARKGGPLTWGVCRQEVRNSISKGSVVVFFFFSSLDDGRVLYRLCGVTTVIDKMDVRAAHGDPRLAQFRQLFINALTRPEKGGWRHDETDRPLSQRHGDWLWRISDHRGVQQKQFNSSYENIYRNGAFPDSALSSGGLKLAKNYVLFATDPPEAFISPVPPEVAVARKGDHEKWNDATLKRLTVDQAATFLSTGRDYLRIVNSSGRKCSSSHTFWDACQSSRLVAQPVDKRPEGSNWTRARYPQVAPRKSALFKRLRVVGGTASRAGTVNIFIWRPRKSAALAQM
jgi:hypothetical protein